MEAQTPKEIIDDQIEFIDDLEAMLKAIKEERKAIIKDATLSLKQRQERLKENQEMINTQHKLIDDAKTDLEKLGGRETQQIESTLTHGEDTPVGDTEVEDDIKPFLISKTDNSGEYYPISNSRGEQIKFYFQKDVAKLATKLDTRTDNRHW